MKHTLLSLSLLLASSSAAWGQAKPISPPTADFQAGATFSFVEPDFSPQHALGFGIYTDYFFTRHFGAELDFHRVDISQHSPSTETTFDYGVVYRRMYGIYHPFLRAGLGRGSLNYPSGISGPSNSLAVLGYNQYNIAGGLDVPVTRSINIRGEIEYQSWFSRFSNPGLIHGLTPALITVGAAYHFNPRRPR